ncbi:MAG: hypothetical protein KAW19_11385 [Candidatus Aminicenantes bacterium]|nr:hypothetical protein [Candidatus Aminicenantes bacterium]
MRKIFLDEYVPQVWKLYLDQAEESVKDGALSERLGKIYYPIQNFFKFKSSVGPINGIPDILIHRVNLQRNMAV